jgi:outer membrane lipopolysaccharide assembly protein LptE/RlpB
MILLIAIVSIGGMLTTCGCFHLEELKEVASTCTRWRERSITSSQAYSTTTFLRFPLTGWRDLTTYDLDDVIPPLHISPAELGPDSTGWITRRGRRGQWQLEAWQITSIAPLELNPDAHAHLTFRVAVGKPPRRPPTRSRGQP